MIFVKTSMKTFFFWAALSILTGLPDSAAAGSSEPLSHETLRTVHPEATSYVYVAKPFPYYIANRGEARIGYAFLTTDVIPNVVGYAGPIQTLVGIDPDGKILALKILQHRETVSYTGQTFKEDWWLKQFLGFKPGDVIALEPHGTINAISSATVSSLAIVRSVDESLKRMAEEVLPKKAGGPAVNPTENSLQDLWRKLTRGEEGGLTPAQKETRQRAEKIRQVLDSGGLQLTPGRYFEEAEEAS